MAGKFRHVPVVRHGRAFGGVAIAVVADCRAARLLASLGPILVLVDVGKYLGGWRGAPESLVAAVPPLLETNDEIFQHQPRMKPV